MLQQQSFENSKKTKTYLFTIRDNFLAFLKRFNRSVLLKCLHHIPTNPRLKETKLNRIHQNSNGLRTFSS